MNLCMKSAVSSTLLKVCSRQQPDELGIGRWKAERRQVLARHPPHRLAEHGVGNPAQHAAVEVERDRPVRVRVRGLEDEFVDVDLSVEFLTKFAPERLGMRLARFNLAAGKLPQPFEVNARLPTRQQVAVAGFDDGGNHLDRNDIAAAAHAVSSDITHGRLVVRLRVDANRAGFRAARFRGPGFGASGFHGYDTHIFVIGQTAHLGVRATQTRAPRSISA